MTVPMRVALVTGAGRGIGAATTHRLVAQGYHVVALDWCAGDDGPYPQATKADLESVSRPYDGRVVGHVGDVREHSTLNAAVSEALERWGRLDVAVAAASVIAGGKPLWDTDREDLELLWEIDAVGVWNTAAAAVPAMLAGPDPGGCRFVAIASAAATHGLFKLAGYNMAKHAVVGMVKGLAADLEGTGVAASVVSPGSTRTDMLQHTAGLYGVDVGDLVGHQLIGRVIEPDEVAAAVLFCCSIEGAVVNGSVVNADGGFRP